MYYTAKCMRLLVCFDHDTNYVVAHQEDDPEQALKGFHNVLEEEEEKGDWGFKGLKQAIKLEFRMQRYDNVGKLASQSPPEHQIMR